MSEVKASNGSKALSIYGQRDEVRELSNRIVKMLPGMRSLGDAGALALAQVAVAMELNPFIGEIWAIPQRSQGRVTSFSIMAGIKGLRRAAREQAKREGGVYPYYRPRWRLLTEDERELVDLKPGDKALVCQLEIMLPPDHPYYKTSGHARYIVEGIGVFRSGERTKMEPIQVVRKRAEADALKIAFDLPFGDVNAEGDYEVIDADYEEVGRDDSGSAIGPSIQIDVPDEAWHQVVGNLMRAGFKSPLHVVKAIEELDIHEVTDDNLDHVLARLRDYLGVDEHEPVREPESEPARPTNGGAPKVNGKRPLEPESIKARMDEKIEGDDGTRASEAQIGLAAAKGRECFAGEPDGDLKYHTVLNFLFGVTSSKSLTKRQAGAMLDWMLTKRDEETGDYPLHQHAPEEAKRIVRHVMETAGQIDMFNEAKTEQA